jgi:hypothetical protein
VTEKDRPNGCIPDKGFTVNVTSNFISWFYFGFFLLMMTNISFLTASLSICLHSNFMLKFATGFFSCANFVGGLIWFIAG